MHEELRTLHDERLVLADKLASVENSKAMLLQLHSDFLGVQGTIEETERLSREAEEALLVAQREAEDLGGQLEGHNRHLQTATDQLDQLRAARIEARAIDRADAYWRNNRTTLRVAYHRFRTAVMSRMRCSRLRLLMVRVRRSVCLRMVMWLWAGFLHRRRVMLCNQGKPSTPNDTVYSYSVSNQKSPNPTRQATARDGHLGAGSLEAFYRSGGDVCLHHPSTHAGQDLSPVGGVHATHPPRPTRRPNRLLLPIHPHCSEAFPSLAGTYHFFGVA